MKEIETLFEVYKDAVFEKDEEKFLSIFDDGIHVFDMWAWSFEGLSAWREMVKGWFGSIGSDRVVVTFEDIRIHGGDTLAAASAYMRFAAISPSGEELRFLYNRLSWVAQKRNGVWKIVHEHTSGPADHETLKVELRRPI